MAEELFSLSGPSEGFFRDRGSKFYAFASPVQSVEEVENNLSALRQQYYDARHHCYAYRLGKHGEITFASDDGEPSHSAGAPILAAIRSFSLNYTAIIVVRYFGGTKLGVRGLIEAYRYSAEEAIKAGTLVPIIPKITFQLSYPYERTSDINRILHRFDTEIVASEYNFACRQTLAVKEIDFPEIRNVLQQAGFSPERISG
ncbi:MAG: YigZ family protein [Bacteroidia bacterium]|nr:YigZ family protein [Bacteroidia bacterium]